MHVLQSENGDLIITVAPKKEEDVEHCPAKMEQSSETIRIRVNRAEQPYAHTTYQRQMIFIQFLHALTAHMLIIIY